ncbi:glutamate receptor 2-like [Saccoglossus kowalevskii]
MEVISVSSTQHNVTDIARIGIWDPVNRLNMSHTPFQSTFKVLQNRTLKIVTIEEEPFVRKTEIRPGVYEYTGFCIDILDEISRKLQFTYVLYDVPDLKYGAKVNGTWNGLVGEVAYGKADMAVAGITIMAEREEVVDFTKPYYQYALGIIISKPRTERGIFAFMEPLSGPVWGCIAAALFVVGIFLFVIARLSPYSSFNYSKKEYCECKGDDFNLKNSYWFALASLMNQGGDTAPYSISGRLLSGFWWFFTLIIIATYTANLTAFLTVSRMETPISSVEELSTQSKIKYGTIRDSSVVSFFKRSTINPYQRMWQFMNTTEVDPYVDTVTDAYRRAKGEEYAFMWDYPVLELQKRIDCDLMTVGKPFYEKGYGFVTPQGADWRDDISMSILEMRENGQLEKYRKKTWEIESECEDDAAMIRSSTNEIDIQSVAGVFYILMIGAGVSLITVSVEILYYHFLRKCCRPTITVHPNVDGKAIEVREENAIEDGKSLSNSRV